MSWSAFRLLCGLSLAPAVSGFMMAAVYVAQWYVGLSLFPSNTCLDSVLDAALSLGLSVSILAFLTTVVVAVPGLYLLFRAGALSPLRVIALGAIAGQAPFMLIALVIVPTQLAQGRPLADASQYWYGTFGMVRAIGLGALLGSTAAATFWFVALWRSDLVWRDVFTAREWSRSPASSPANEHSD